MTGDERIMPTESMNSVGRSGRSRSTQSCGWAVILQHHLCLEKARSLSI